jgi:hypothetical protein
VPSARTELQVTDLKVFSTFFRPARVTLCVTAAGPNPTQSVAP